MKGLRPTKSARQRRRDIKTARRLEAVRAANIEERWSIALEAMRRQKRVIDAIIGTEAGALLDDPNGIQASGDSLYEDRAQALELARALHDQAHNVARAGRIAHEAGDQRMIDLTHGHYSSILALFLALGRRWRFTADEIPCSEEHGQARV